MPGNPGGILSGFQPRGISLPSVARGLLNPRNLRNFGVGGLVGTLIADQLLMHANAHFALWINGLTVVGECDPQAGMFGWTASFPSDIHGCLAGVGMGASLRALPAFVATADPKVIIRAIGLKITTPFGAQFGNEGKRYGIVPYNVGGARPRPFYGPLNHPGWAAPGTGVAAPPGHVPWDIAPWPVWGGAGPRPGVDNGNGVPAGAGSGSGGGRRDIPRNWSIAPDRSVSRPIPNVRAVPVPGMRETKVGANTEAGRMFFALMRAKEAVSELGDVAEALFKALPKATQKRYPNNLGGWTLALYDNLEWLDFRLAFRNLLANQIEDEIIGRTYFGLKGSARNAVFGKSMGALPGGNAGLRDYAKAVSDAVAGVVDPYFGYTDGAVHKDDAANRVTQDERRRELIKRLERAGLLRRGANQSPPPPAQSRA